MVNISILTMVYKPTYNWEATHCSNRKIIMVNSGVYGGYNYLVGGIPTPLKNMKVGWDDYSQTWTNITCSKLPPRYIYI